MAVTDIVLRLISDTKAYQEDIKKATDTASKTLRTTGDFGSVLGKILGNTSGIAGETSQVLSSIGNWAPAVNLVGTSYTSLVGKMAAATKGQLALSAASAGWIGLAVAGVAAVTYAIIQMSEEAKKYEATAKAIRDELDAMQSTLQKGAAANEKFLDPFGRLEKDQLEIEKMGKAFQDLKKKREELVSLDIEKTMSNADMAAWAGGLGGKITHEIVKALDKPGSGGIGDMVKLFADKFGKPNEAIANIDKQLANTKQFASEDAIKKLQEEAVERIKKAYNIEDVEAANKAYAKSVKGLGKLLEEGMVTQAEFQNGMKNSLAQYLKSQYGFEEKEDPKDRYNRLMGDLEKDLMAKKVNEEQANKIREKLYADYEKTFGQLIAQQKAAVEKFREMAKTPFEKYAEQLAEMAEAAKNGGFTQDMTKRLEEQINDSLASSLGLSDILGRLETPAEKYAKQLENLNIYAIKTKMSQEQLIKAQNLLRESYNKEKKGTGKNDAIEMGTMAAYQLRYGNQNEPAGKKDAEKIVKEQEKTTKNTEKANDLTAKTNTLIQQEIGAINNLVAAFQKPPVFRDS